MKKGIVVMPCDLEGADWLERIKALRLDTLGVHSGGGPNHDVLKGLGETASAIFRKQCADAGVSCEYELHAAQELLDPALFQTHPDYFALNPKTGERGTSSNSCVSNPEVAEIISRNAERLARALPSPTRCYYFWGADTNQSACACPRCASYSPAEQNLLAMNAVARGIRRVDPGAMVACIIYMGCYELPVKVVPEENVFFEFAPYVRCYDHSIADRTCEQNRVFAKCFQEYVDAYGASRMKILEYWLDSSLFSNYHKPAVVPPVSKEIMRRDMDFYCSAGIRDITTFAVYMGKDYFSEKGDEKLREYAEVVNEFLPAP